jgi:AbrB family looped-hinge helix DNA binding protein
MSRVTSKLQVTMPKAIAEQFGIRPGDEITWVPAGEVIRVVPPRRKAPTLDLEARLHLFDAATERQKRRQAGARQRRTARERGWRREDLYSRGHAR